MSAGAAPVVRAAEPSRVRAARRSLLRWYDAHRRDLPWRRSRDPYAIWISEAMLQQTRVETVIPYYERFLARFPDVQTLADAGRDDVYALWAGLGYYSRARNLHDAARVVVDEHGGALPDSAESLRTLPGVGRYTAGTVASIAFGRPEPVLDGNVIRVLSRWQGVRKDVGQKPVQDGLWTLAAEFAPGARPGDLNQALMELGATLCTPKAPRCVACPLVRSCDARAHGDAEKLPVKERRSAPQRMEAAAAWLERRGQLLLVQPPHGGLLGGLWALPGGELERAEAPEEGLRRQLRERLGLEVKRAAHAGSVEHVFTHRRLELHVFRCGEPVGRVRRAGLAAHRWVAPGRIDELALGAPARKALALLAGGEPRRVRARPARERAARRRS